MAVTRGQQRASRPAAQNLPGEVLERVLAHLPLRDRLNAEVVCIAWNRHLGQRSLPLWQAVSIDDHGVWEHSNEDGDQCSRTVRQLGLFSSLQRWLCNHGRGLLQVQCGTSFHPEEWPDEGLLAAFLATLAASARSLQALRLDGCAARDMTNRTLVGLAPMCCVLRQLALVGLLHVTDDSLLAALLVLPMLEDLAVIFEDATERQEVVVAVAGMQGQQPMPPRPPDFMRLLDGVAGRCSRLRTLAFGHLPAGTDMPRWSDIVVHEKPLLASLSQLSALSTLALHNIGWQYAPTGLPRLPQLRRLNLRSDFDEASREGADLQHQFSSLTTLEALQAMLPDWPGRLPHGLTHLVLAPLDGLSHKYLDHAVYGHTFLREYLPPLRGLRHLAFHHMVDIGDKFLLKVACKITAVPAALCELSQLQLLDLSHNWDLHRDGYSNFGSAPLHKLTSCKRLDVQCESGMAHHSEARPLRQSTLENLAGMPALEQLALPCVESNVAGAEAFEEAQLARHRDPGLPPIRVVTVMLQSDRWAAVDVELPFAEVNDVLGVQLDRSIVSGVHFEVTQI